MPSRASRIFARLGTPFSMEFVKERTINRQKTEAGYPVIDEDLACVAVGLGLRPSCWADPRAISEHTMLTTSYKLHTVCSHYDDFTQKPLSAFR